MDNKVFKVSMRPFKIMTNEVKETSEERIEKLADEVIDENKRLLKRLEVEEKETIISDQSIAGVDPFLEPVEVITNFDLMIVLSFNSYFCQGSLTTSKSIDFPILVDKLLYSCG